MTEISDSQTKHLEKKTNYEKCKEKLSDQTNKPLPTYGNQRYYRFPYKFPHILSTEEILKIQQKLTN